jgi:hypothetical protein
MEPPTLWRFSASVIPIQDFSSLLGRGNELHNVPNAVMSISQTSHWIRQGLGIHPLNQLPVILKVGKPSLVGGNGNASLAIHTLLPKPNSAVPCRHQHKSPQLLHLSSATRRFDDALTAAEFWRSAASELGSHYRVLLAHRRRSHKERRQHFSKCGLNCRMADTASFSACLVIFKSPKLLFKLRCLPACVPLSVRIKNALIQGLRALGFAGARHFNPFECFHPLWVTLVIQNLSNRFEMGFEGLFFFRIHGYCFYNRTHLGWQLK